MKKLNLFAMGVVAMLVAAAGVNAATVNGEKLDVDGRKKTYTTLALCLAETDESSCTLTANENISGLITKDVTIVTAGHKLTVTAVLTIDNGKTVTIDGGRLEVTANVTINDSATLNVVNAHDDLTAYSGNDMPSSVGAIGIDVPSSVSAVTIKVDHGTLNVNNNDRGIVNRKAPTNILIELVNGKLALNGNRLNAMNGGEVTASYSTIEANNNGMGGFNSKLTLAHSTLTATGNGYSGATLADASSIDGYSTLEVTKNNVGSKDMVTDRTPDKADLLLSGSLSIAKGGTLTADSVAPVKDLWNATGVVSNSTVTIAEGANINVGTVKTLCKGNTIGGTCTAAGDKGTIAFAGSGVVVEGNVATIYGSVSEGYEFPATVKKVVVSAGAANGLTFVVAPGTVVVNNSTHQVAVSNPNGANSQFVASTKTVTVGTATATPGDNDPEKDPEKDPEENPDTLDNVTSTVAMGGISLAIAAAGIATLKKREN